MFRPRKTTAGQQIKEKDQAEEPNDVTSIVNQNVVADDQSAKSELLNRLNVCSPTTSYPLRTCAGTTRIQGRCSKRHKLSNVIEYNS